MRRRFAQTACSPSRAPSSRSASWLLTTSRPRAWPPRSSAARIDCLAEVKRRGAQILLVEQNFRVAQAIGESRRREWTMAAWVHLAAPWGSRRRRRLGSTGCSASVWIRTMSAQDVDSGAALRKRRRDFVPLAIAAGAAAIAYPFIPSSSTWLTLTIAGLADGR